MVVDITNRLTLFFVLSYDKCRSVVVACEIFDLSLLGLDFVLFVQRSSWVLRPLITKNCRII